MLAFINQKGNHLWEENGKVVLMENEQEANVYGQQIMSKYMISQKNVQGNNQFIMQGIDPNAPMLQLIEWINGLYQGFETISFKDLNK